MQRERVLEEHHRLLETLDRPAEAQQRLLTRMVDQHADTAFATAHGLGAVRTLDDLRKAVPIRTHEELMPWIDRIMDGEPNVLTPDAPLAYFSSSGSTGREKHIPATPSYLKQTYLPFYHAAFAPLLLTIGDQVLTGPGSVLNLWQDPTAPAARSRDGRPHIGVSQLDYRKLGEDSAIGQGNEAPWSRIPEDLAAANPWDRAYFKLRLAAEQNIRLLIGINPAMVAGLPYQLRQMWPRIAEEIRAGTLDGRPHTAPNPERAAEIEQYAKAFGTLHPHHLWPRLRAILVWNSALASLYLPRVRETYGPGVQLFPAPIASCEGPAAVPVDRHPGAPPYLPGCVYEFAPADAPVTADSATLPVTELDEGADYHLVFSHPGGLYRCAVTDVVRVVGRIGRAPRLEYAGRNTLRSAAGEHLTEAAALRALDAACHDTGAEIRNAAFRIDPKAPPERAHYQAAIAFAGPVAPALAAALDARLAQECPGYGTARRNGRIAPVEVLPVHPDAFLREWERAIRAGQRPPRVKDRVFPSDPAAWARIVGPTAGRPA
ncbi:GH3 family domain-containing protein [Streptomyces boninensis]|uniref:GH3 family domain-containing protein n=1 Tax=Streptomyces boninensis TaxID=2039455 RepID=UPI003B226680